ncbi:MAG: phage portal protein [Hyphomicrobiaceae bacterium]
MPRMTNALTRLLPWRARATAGMATTGMATKASKAHRLLALESLGQPQWAPRDYAAFAREGFMQNAIVYRCVRMVSEAAASIPLLLYEGAFEIESHPFLDLIAQPSLDHTSSDFFESWYGYLLVSGNAYVEAVGVEGALRELHVLRPDRMKVIPGADGWPEAYEYAAGGHSIRLAGDVVDGVRSVLHVRLFHPANDYYGMSPIEAAASAIDIHNQAAKWNKALLDNSARPSGALVYAAREGQLTEEQFQRLKEELELGFQGARQAGRPMLLEGGLDWKPLSLSPKDMDFVEAKNAAAREIALALGVPPMLLGIPGDNTYSNYQEASRSFWRQTVLPLVVRTAKAMSAWLAPAWGGGLKLRPDLDAIEALSSERDQLWARLEKASFLTDDEKRAAAGYGPMPERERGDGLTAQSTIPTSRARGRATPMAGGGRVGEAVE